MDRPLHFNLNEEMGYFDLDRIRLVAIWEWKKRWEGKESNELARYDYDRGRSVIEGKEARFVSLPTNSSQDKKGLRERGQTDRQTQRERESDGDWCKRDISYHFSIGMIGFHAKTDNFKPFTKINSFAT